MLVSWCYYGQPDFLLRNGLFVTSNIQPISGGFLVIPTRSQYLWTKLQTRCNKTSTRHVRQKVRETRLKTSLIISLLGLTCCEACSSERWLSLTSLVQIDQLIGQKLGANSLESSVKGNQKIAKSMQGTVHEFCETSSIGWQCSQWEHVHGNLQGHANHYGTQSNTGANNCIVRANASLKHTF